MQRKFLFVSPVPTDCKDAGNRVRIAALAEVVKSLGYEVHFAYVPMEAADVDAMRKRFGDQCLHLLKFHPISEGVIKSVIRRGGRLFRQDFGYLWGVDDWFDVGVGLQLQLLHEVHQFHAVCVEYVFMSRALDFFPSDVLKLLDTHDSFAYRHRKYLRAGEKPQWFSTTADEEARGFARANRIFAIQSDEALEFIQHLGDEFEGRVVEVGHIVELADKPVTPSRSPSALFLGSSNPINSAAINWFRVHVLPLVLLHHPDFLLRVAGSVCGQIAPGPGVELLGYVPNLREAFSCAALNVNPVQMGTGLNIKLLDALAHGAPSITTRSGARGFECVGSDALEVVGDMDAPAFAAKVVQLLSDRVALERLGGLAYQSAVEWNNRQRSNLQQALNWSPNPCIL